MMLYASLRNQSCEQVVCWYDLIQASIAPDAKAADEAWLFETMFRCSDFVRFQNVDRRGSF